MFLKHKRILLIIGLLLATAISAYIAFSIGRNTTSSYNSQDDGGIIKPTALPSAFPSPTPPQAIGSGGCAPAGCSGELCVEADKAADIATGCIWKEIYACTKQMRCERQAHTGECGWTETSASKACVREYQNNLRQLDEAQACSSNTECPPRQGCTMYQCVEGQCQPINICNQ